MNITEIGGYGPDLCSSGCGLVVGFCEHSNEPLDSLKGREFIDQLSDTRLPEENCPPWS